MVARVLGDRDAAPAAPSWRRRALGFFAAFVLCALPFVLWPQIDLAVARWLWQAQGGRFQEPIGWFYPIYVGLRPVVYAVAGAIALLAVVNLATGRRLLGLDLRVAAFLLLSLALGPGIAVDVGLKDHWGRARPRDLVEFGGTRSFTSAFQPADQCADNCSFVSGHAALAFGFVCFAFVVSGRRRRGAFLAVGAFGAAVGAMRMVQGAHFLSDVIFAGFVVLGIAGVLAALILAPERPAAGRI